MKDEEKNFFLLPSSFLLPSFSSFLQTTCTQPYIPSLKCGSTPQITRIQSLFGEVHGFDAILQRQEGQARVEAAIDAAVVVIDEWRSRRIGDTDLVGEIDLDIAWFLAVPVHQHVVKPGKSP